MRDAEVADVAMGHAAGMKLQPDGTLITDAASHKLRLGTTSKRGLDLDLCMPWYRGRRRA